VTDRKKLLNSFLISYSWEQERKIFRVSLINDSTVPYGYEYTAQAPLFTPLFAADRWVTSFHSFGNCIGRILKNKEHVQTINQEQDTWVKIISPG
jgi:hypothetical protein